jgi:hypothetical protein
MKRAGLGFTPGALVEIIDAPDGVPTPATADAPGAFTVDVMALQLSTYVPPTTGVC